MGYPKGHNKGKQTKDSAVVKGAKNKPPRWKKGHSCVSKPSVNKYRLAAKQKSNVFSIGSSNLTQKQLAQHDSKFRDESSEMEEDVKSYKSVASTVASNCSNTTFMRVIGRISTSQSALNTQILAIVGATTDEILAKGGTQTDTECCAALLSLLNSKEPLDVYQKTAVLYLLKLSMKRVPPSVLQLKSKDILTLLASNTEEECEDQSLMKSLITCVTHCLRAQQQNAWQTVLIRDNYMKILSATISPKPKMNLLEAQVEEKLEISKKSISHGWNKTEFARTANGEESSTLVSAMIRKAAQHAIGAILRGSKFMTTDHAPHFHPIANDTYNFCNKVLENTKGAQNVTRILHVLGLLQNVLSAFSTSGIKSTCDLMLSLLGSTDVLLKSVTLKTLHSFFSMAPKPENLTQKLNCQIINALYDFMPKADPDAMLGWLAVMEKAYCNLSRFDKEPQASAQVDKLMDVMVSLMKENAKSTVFESFKTVGNLYPTAFKKYLPLLDQFYMSEGYSHKEEIEKLMGMAVQKLGPREVLNILPLKITGNSDTDGDFPRSWLIPVLRDYVQKAELGFYGEHFVPLIGKISDMCKTLSEKNNKSRLLAYTALLHQLWSLLPSFCNRPTDVVQSFPMLAKFIGTAIKTKSEVTMDALSALRKLVNQSMENEAEKKKLAHYAKNFLPAFFTVYMAREDSDKKESDEGIRLSVLETLKCYLKVSPVDVVVLSFDECVQKLKKMDDLHKELEQYEKDRIANRKPKEAEKIQEEKDCVEAWCSLTDLITALLPFVPVAKLEKVKEILITNLQSSNNSIQKKSYRLLQNCPVDFILEQLPLLTTFKNDNENSDKKFTVANPSAQGPRLRCLSTIIEMFDTPQVDFVAALAPEVIMCVKATSERARTAAYDLLVKMGQKFLNWFPDKSPENSIHMYLELFVNGLRVDNQHVVSCTVLALARVLFNFKEIVSDDEIGAICSMACLLLAHKSREIVQSALGLVHVLMSGYGDTISGKFLPDLITGLGHLQNIPSFRTKIKDILRKLLKKCGFEILHGMLPEVYRKILKNLVKVEKKAKTKPTKEDESAAAKKSKSIDDLLEDSDDDDSGSDDGDDEGKRRPKKQTKVWIKEGEEILDFSHPSAAQNITATRPKKVQKNDDEKKDTNPFKIAKDGRLIILDDESEKKSKKKIDLTDVNLKRKHDDVEDDDDGGSDADITDLQPTQSYRAGGRGIHRPLDGKTKADQPKGKGKPSPAKKAKTDSSKGKVKKGRGDPTYAYEYVRLTPPNKRNKHESMKKLKEIFRKRKNWDRLSK